MPAVSRAGRGLLGPSLLALALAAAACGPVAATPRSPGVPAAASPTPASPSPTPTPQRYVIAVVEPIHGTVSFLDSEGRQSGQATIPWPVATATVAGRLWYVDAANHLRAVGVDGQASDMGALQGMTAAGPGGMVYGLAVSGDGRAWAWGECAGCGSSGGRARVYTGGVGAAEKVVLDEPASPNEVLIPLGYTAHGLVVVRAASGFGGCCYLPPETGHEDVLLVDPTTMQVTQTFKGCVSAYATPLGSFACTGSTVVVHLPDGSTQTVTPTSPLALVGWVHVDDAGGRVVFGVIHSRGQGGGGCPCKIDTEAAALNGGSVTTLADQMLPEAVLPDGRIVATMAPMIPGSGPYSIWIVSPDGTRVQLGAATSELVAVLPLP